jgi:antitoxin component YwqK of YwqJK toxin-antitoxin module
VGNALWTRTLTMKRLIILLLTAITIQSFGQQGQERILYVVDSIPIINDPDEDDGELTEQDIETVTAVTNKDEIEKHGYKDLDKLIFIITKEYAKRPDELNKIPTLAQMERKNGRWFIMSTQTPYTGQFIEFYMNGRLKGKGNFKDGLADGLRTAYFQDGKTRYIRNYVNGLENGEFKQFFANGKIEQEGIFKDAKEDGIWKLWYSTGELKKQVEFKNGKEIATKEDEKFYRQFSNASKLSSEGNYSSAIKAFDKVIELNPNYSDLYFHRGTAYLYDMKFDEAIKDYDRAIELEPLYKESISNRAFARLRKHEFKNSRTLSKNSGVTVLASKDKVEIPKEELDKICADLNLGYSLGDKSQMILEAINKYCQ